MMMANAETKESLKTKVLLLVLDKVIFALLIAVAGFLFNSLLQDEKIRVDYQRKLFEKRVDAYIEILQSAKESHDYLAVLYLRIEERPNALRRQEELSLLLQRLHSISSGMHGGSIHFGTYEGAFEPLQRLEKITREKEIYISDTASSAVGNYLDVVAEDLEKQIARMEQEKGSPGPGSQLEERRERERAAWEHADAAYRRLRAEIHEKLALEDVPIG